MNARSITWPYATHLGFDKFFNELDQAITQGVTASNAFPRHNIVKITDTDFRIELALAGISREALDIEVNQNQLTISTEKVESEDELEYLHKGISQRGFNRSFTLADHVIVKGADMIDGILKISLERQIPDELKPRKIDISSDK